MPTSRRDELEVVADASWRVRGARPADARRWFEILSDPVQVALGAPAFVTPPADPQAMAERIEQSAAAATQRRPGTLVVAGLDDDVVVADVAWRLDLPAPFRIADVGYAVHPDARGRGVATAAVSLLAAWLTTDADGPGLHRVQCAHSVENPGSCRVAERAGMAREGVRPSFLPMRDDTRPGGVRHHDICQHGLVSPV